MKRKTPVITHCRARRFVVGAALSLGIGAAAASAFAQDLNATLREKNCLACHAWDKKLVGPAYSAVRARYSASDLPQLVVKVLNGGSGSWGAIPMPASRPRVNSSEAQFLVAGILGVSGAGAQLPNPPTDSPPPSPARNSATKSLGGGS
ncbi:MAG: cytochrome C551 [Serpentinimonas sp.]|jgi:cytochrome c|nr:cytochrome C551 [Serpentinimonas sp.]